MEHFAGIDVSLEVSSVCVVDAAGRIVREAKVASEPEALTAWFRGLGLEVTRGGLEVGPLSPWLHAGVAAAACARRAAALGAEAGRRGTAAHAAEWACAVRAEQRRIMRVEVSGLISCKSRSIPTAP